MEARVEQIFFEEMRNDTAYQGRESVLELIFPVRYNKDDMRRTWHLGVKHGIEIGLNRASIKGQRVNLFNHAATPKQKEFLEKSYALSEEYNCQITYHPRYGMLVMDLDRSNN